MEGQYQVIDLATWKRGAHFEFFRKAQIGWRPFGTGSNKEKWSFMNKSAPHSAA